MLLTAVVLNMISALGLCVMGGKYYFGPAPADYHVEILGVSRDNIGSAQITVFSALYRVLGAAFFGLAIALASMSWFAVAADLLWAKLTVLITGLAVGLPASRITYAIHRKTGVETPWKPAVGILAIMILAFVLSVL